MAFGTRTGSCGHVESVSGVRRGSHSSRHFPCGKCQRIIRAIKGEMSGLHRPTPFDHFSFSSGTAAGMTFDYKVEGITVECRILTVEEAGGEYLMSTSRSVSVGGKTEMVSGSLRASFARMYTVIKILAVPQITGVTPIEVSRRYEGWLSKTK